MRSGKAGVGVVAGLVLATLVIAGRLCVDDGFVRRYRACDLRLPAGRVGDERSVGPSAIGLLRWRPGFDLAANLGPVEAGDVVKLSACSPDGAQVVLVAVDGAAVAELAVGASWRQHEVVLPVAGRTLRLRRHDPAGPGVELSRLSVANTVGHAAGVVELALRHRLAGASAREQRPVSRLLVLALPPALLLLLAVAARRRGRGWADAVGAAALALVPSAALLATAAAVPLATPWRLTFPGRTLAVLLLLPVGAPPLARLRRARVARGARPSAAAVPRVALVHRPRAQSGQLAAVDGDLDRRRRPGSVRAPGGPAAAALAVRLGRGAVPAGDGALRRRPTLPSPPGYPAYVATAHLLDAFVGDPTRALQLASVLGSTLALLGVALALRRLDAPLRAVAVAGTLLACVPAFSFYCNVGTADALAAGIATLALGACAASLAAPPGSTWLVAAAGLAAAALATRPQLGALLAGPGLWVVSRAVWNRSFRSLGAAVATGLGISAACWVPAVAMTGWGRFADALRRQRQWMVRNEVADHLPGAPLGRVLDAWLVQPLGSPGLAVWFWLLVAVGCVGWWRSGRRRVVILAGSASVSYLLAATWALNLTSSVRYVVPALPCLVVLAAGVTVVKRPPLRAGLTAAAAVLALVHAGWGAPVYLLRAREVAPTWGALSWTCAHADPGSTQVVYAREIEPHAQRVLSGSSLLAVGQHDPRVPTLPGPEVWMVGPRWWVGDGELLHQEYWPSDRLRGLTRGNYNGCAVARRRPGAWRAAFDEPVPQGVWRLAGARALRLAPGSNPAAVRVVVTRGTVAARRQGELLLTLGNGSGAELPLTPTAEGALELAPVEPGVELETELLEGGGGPPAAARWYVPSVAHAPGSAGTRWTSDLDLVNTGGRAVTCRLALLSSHPDGPAPSTAVLPVPAGGRLRLTDAVRMLFGVAAAGAIALDADRPELEVRSTMHRHLAGGERLSVEIPLATVRDLLDPGHPGEAVAAWPAADQRDLRTNLGLVNPGTSAAVVTAEVAAGPAGGPAPFSVRIAPRSYSVVRLDGADVGARVRVRVTTPDSRVLAHLSLIDDATGRWAFLPVAPALVAE